MTCIDYSSEDGDAYHLAHHGEFLGNKELLEAWGHYAHCAYFSFIQPGQSVLEFGAGVGANLVSVKKICKVYAVEKAVLAQKHCQTLEIPVVPALDQLRPELRFDAILLRHVLEHIPDPKALLLDLRGRLTKGGRLIVILPIESPWANIKASDTDHHLYSWNRQTIANLLTISGYRVMTAKIHWFNGKRIFLPLYKFFGSKIYCVAMRTFGFLRGRCEISVEACADASCVLPS
jgi:SAM-dependent methyltransferase